MKIDPKKLGDLVTAYNSALIAAKPPGRSLNGEEVTAIIKATLGMSDKDPMFLLIAHAMMWVPGGAEILCEREKDNLSWSFGWSLHDHEYKCTIWESQSSDDYGEALSLGYSTGHFEDEMRFNHAKFMTWCRYQIALNEARIEAEGGVRAA